MKESTRLFDYQLSDGWNRPISRLTIYEGEPCRIRLIGRRPGSFMWDTEERQLEVDAGTAEKLRAIVRGIAVRELEAPRDGAQERLVQDFAFLAGEEFVRLRGKDLDRCAEQAELCPNAAAMAETLAKLGEVLIPLGVARRYFLLGV